MVRESLELSLVGGDLFPALELGHERTEPNWFIARDPNDTAAGVRGSLDRRCVRVSPAVAQTFPRHRVLSVDWSRPHQRWRSRQLAGFRATRTQLLSATPPNDRCRRLRGTPAVGCGLNRSTQYRPSLQTRIWSLGLPCGVA